VLYSYIVIGILYIYCLNESRWIDRWIDRSIDRCIYVCMHVYMCAYLSYIFNAEELTELLTFARIRVIYIYILCPRSTFICKATPPHRILPLVPPFRYQPHIVQSWMDPLQQARPLRRACETAGVAFQAYSTLGTQHRSPINPVLRHPVVMRLADTLGKTTGQVRH